MYGTDGELLSCMVRYSHLELPTNYKCCQQFSMLQYCLMDLSFSMWPLECKVSVADEHHQL
jgi:hypothetical protein